VTQDPIQPVGPDGDLEYELAHEDHARGEPTAPPADEPAPMTYVATETPDYAGDYEYDLSHDVPKLG
jgi:hypothetical protein